MWGKNKTTNTIEFVALNKYGFEVSPKPFPASQAIPQWWKDATPYSVSKNNPDGKKLIIENHESNASFKKCTPMLDMLSSGYVVPLWADVQVKIKNDQPSLNWRVKNPVFDLHNGHGIEKPDGYHQVKYKFINQWIPKLPRGYSALITPCFGYPNNVFRIISAVIDYDKTTHALFPPVYIKEGFEGIVEKGTPMFQIIPFKRSNWDSEFSFLKDGDFEIQLDRDVKATIVNNYIKNFWEKKNYK